MFCVTVGVARLRALTAQWSSVSSKGPNLHPFTGNGRWRLQISEKLSMWTKNPKQTNILFLKGYFFIFKDPLNNALKLFFSINNEVLNCLEHMLPTSRILM